MLLMIVNIFSGLIICASYKSEHLIQHTGYQRTQSSQLVAGGSFSNGVVKDASGRIDFLISQPRAA